MADASSGNISVNRISDMPFLKLLPGLFDMIYNLYLICDACIISESSGFVNLNI